MLTVNDLIFSSILPLIFGISVAVFLRKVTGPNYIQSISALLTLIAGYFGLYATMNFAFADGDTIVQKVVQSVSQTAIELLNPPTAIQWIPLIAAASLAISIIIARFRSADNLIETADASPPSLWTRLPLYGLLVALAASAVLRLLWTSAYFTDRYTMISQIGYVVFPALLIGAVWHGGFSARGFWHPNYSQRISRWASVSTLLLSASALVLLMSSGSFTLGLLQIPVLSAALVSAVFFPSTSDRRALHGDAWLIAIGVCLPVTIGFFFAEVHWETAALFAVSSALVTTLPPLATDNNAQKAGIAIAACVPAAAAAIWAAILLSQAISPYGGYQ